MMNLELPGKSWPYLMAHRGNSTLCPENTLAAFQKAIEEGADIVETDLHLTADEAFVCIHDATVDRTTDGSGAVAEMTLEELKALSASYGRPGFADERILTLDELLAYVSGKCALALELKTDRFLEPEVCRALVQKLSQAGMIGQVVIISFSLSQILAVQSAAPEIPIGLIGPREAAPCPDVQLLGPTWPLLQQNPDYVAQAHRQGQRVCPLDEESDSRLEIYQQMGCDVILSNNAGETARAMRALGFRS